MKAKLTASNLANIRPAATRYDIRDTEIRGFLLRVMPSGKATYFYQYRNGAGRQQSYRIGDAGSLKPRQARDIAETVAGRVLSGIDVQAERNEGRERGKAEKFQTWGGFLEHKYSPWVTTHRKQGDATLTRLEANFKQWKGKPLTDLNAWIVEKWRADRLKAGRSKATLNRDIGDLKAALTKAVEWGVLEASPLAKLKPYRVDEGAKIRYLTPDEEKRLRAALQARDEDLRAGRDRGNDWRRERGRTLLPDLRAVAYPDYLTPMVLLAKNTGLRRGELFNLEWADVNLSGKTVTVRGEGAKSGQTRHVPLNGEAHAVLKAWKEQTDGARVFAGKDGATMTNIKNAWRGLMKRAKLDDFRFHDLRHDFASKLVMAGVPLNTVRDLLGHSDLKTTLRYAHLAPDHKASAVEQLC